MGYEQSDDLQLALKLFYPGPQLFPDHGIQSPERFIKQKNPRLYCKRPGKSHALAPASFLRALQIGAVWGCCLPSYVGTNAPPFETDLEAFEHFAFWSRG
jgi:hypothetical protein